MLFKIIGIDIMRVAKMTEKIYRCFNDIEREIQCMKDISQDKIVFTNGCFDLFHYGHLQYLYSASLRGRLVVGVNSDSSVKLQNKGNCRPIIPDYQRAEIINNLSFVDMVIIFDEKVPQQLLQCINPHKVISTEHYDVATIDSMISLCNNRDQIIIERVKILPEISTSNIISKCVEASSVLI